MRNVYSEGMKAVRCEVIDNGICMCVLRGYYTTKPSFTNFYWNLKGLLHEQTKFHKLQTKLETKQILEP